MAVFFAWIIWFWLLITVFSDLFRRHDASGFTKVLWMIFVIILPYLGVFIYLIANHDGMTERAVKQQQAAQEQLDQRDVWFVADDPVTALDDAASRLLVALGDAITAAGANFYFDAGEPFVPAGHADDAYIELGDAIRHWKAQMLDEQRRRQHPRVESEELI